MIRQISLKSLKKDQKRNNSSIYNTPNGDYLCVLFQSNEDGKVPLFSNGKIAKRLNLVLEKPSLFTNIRTLYGSLSTKSTLTDKEKTLTVAKCHKKQDKTLNPFYSSMKSVQQKYRHQLNANVESKTKESRSISSKVLKLSNNVNQWIEELEKNNKFNKDIESSSAQLEIHLQRLNLENKINSNEIAELKDEIAKMQHDINSLERESVEYNNQSDKAINLIEGIRRQIRQLPKDNNMLENQNRNIRAALLLIGNNSNGIRFALNNEARQSRVFKKDIEHVMRIYDAATK